MRDEDIQSYDKALVSDDLLERFEGGDSIDDFKDTFCDRSFLDRFEDGVSVDSTDTFTSALDASLLRREFCVSSC